MLAGLRVKNFALIEELDLSFGPGFNVMTGETGAGKSIVVGAINLILGGRAFTDLIRQGEDSAEVEALFTVGAEAGALRLLEELGFDPQEEILIRRVLSRSGRNRIYINGSLATLAQLARLGSDLVAVSGQHEHQQLLDPDRQLLFLDQFGGLLSDRAAAAEAHDGLSALETEAKALARRLAEAREKAELYEFQAKEIEAASLAEGEDEELERERNLLRNAEKIYSLVSEGYARLYEDRGSVVEVLDGVRNGLERAAGFDDRLEALAGQVEEAYHQLDDAARSLRDHLDGLTFDPARLEAIEDRLAVINRLKRKYGPTLGEVTGYGRATAGRLENLADMENELKGLRSDVSAARSRLDEKAESLSHKRKKAARRLADALGAELKNLGMPQAEFRVALSRDGSARPGPAGWDEAEFLISPNLGEEVMPLARIASGGELSRTMLALKTLLAGQDRIQTVIFDEVDAGISGAVAEVVGRKLRDLSSFHQLLCITHLPQIAAFGEQHHQVFKEVRGKRTITGMRPLAGEEKLEEIARLLSGARPTDKSRAAAEELIALTAKGRPKTGG